jgi:hypothetical protein
VYHSSITTVNHHIRHSTIETYAEFDLSGNPTMTTWSVVNNLLLDVHSCSNQSSVNFTLNMMAQCLLIDSKFALKYFFKQQFLCVLMVYVLLCIYEKLCSLHATTFNHCVRKMFNLRKTVIQAVCYIIQTTCFSFFLSIIRCIRKNKCYDFCPEFWDENGSSFQRHKIKTRVRVAGNIRDYICNFKN